MLLRRDAGRKEFTGFSPRGPSGVRAIRDPKELRCDAPPNELRCDTGLSSSISVSESMVVFRRPVATAPKNLYIDRPDHI